MDKNHPGYEVLRRHLILAGPFTLRTIACHLESNGASKAEVTLALEAIDSGPSELAAGLTRVLRERGYE